MIFTFIAIFLKSVRLDPRSDMAFNCDETTSGTAESIDRACAVSLTVPILSIVISERVQLMRLRI